MRLPDGAVVVCCGRAGDVMGTGGHCGAAEEAEGFPAGMMTNRLPIPIEFSLSFPVEINWLSSG